MMKGDVILVQLLQAISDYRVEQSDAVVKKLESRISKAEQHLKERYPFGGYKTTGELK